MRVHLKGINTVRKRLADGTVATYYYHRETGHRLAGKPGSPEFIASIADAEQLVADRLAGRLKGTFNGLVREFTASSDFEALAESTQREYRRQLTTAERQFGDMPIAALNDPALILALHTGQRQGDLLRLVWTAYDGTFIRLRQSKAKRRGVAGPLVEIPVTAALKRMLDGMPRIATTILTSRTGKPFRKRYFAKLWAEAAAAAGITNLHFHDLRGTAVTMLSEAGCTPQQVAAITGHSQKSVETILGKYLARTRGLAEQAIFQFENSPRTKFANQLQTDTGEERKGTKKSDV